MATATLPDFLSARADVATRLATQLALPSRRDEAWRRTSLEGLEPDQYKVAPANVRLIGKVPDGVVFAPLLDAARAHNELLRTYLGTLLPVDLNKLTALQAANLSGGVFLYIPPGVTVKEPLQVIYTAAAGQAQYIHTVVVAGEGASVTLLERYEGEGDYLNVGVVEVFALDNARVRYGYLQNQSQDAWSFTFRRGRTGRGAELDWVGGEFGGSLVRSEIVTTVEGDGSESNIKLVYGATGRQHIDIVANETHTGQNSRSNILGRGVLSGRAHTVFRGNGTIKFGARNCATYQKQQALLLSDKSRADSIPALIIDETEVSQAGHAATVGKLDEEQLFYLMARGLSKSQATRLLVMAFLTPILPELPVEALREELTALMSAKVGS